MKKNKFLEISWLTIAVICLGIAIFESFRSGFNENYRFFIFAIIAMGMYFLRRSSSNKNEEIK